MKKIKSAVVLILLYFVLPLIGNPALLLHWKVLFILASCLVIWFSQPPITVEDAEANRKKDRNTVLIIIGLSGVAIIAPLIEWAYFGNSGRNSSLAATLSGLVLITGGTAFRYWSIRTLGQFFTATVQVQGEQRIITSGPYALVRHPSYLGSFLAVVGFGVLLGAFGGAFIAALSMGIAYYLRIEAEERTLVEAFGDIYRRYQQHTNRMVPGLW